MSHNNVKSSEDNYKSLSYSLENSIEKISEEIETANDSEPGDDSLGQLAERVERLKDDVKNLKKIRKQQEKLGKLEGKKLEILKEIEKEQERERKSRARHDKRKK